MGCRIKVVDKKDLTNINALKSAWQACNRYSSGVLSSLFSAGYFLIAILNSNDATNPNNSTNN